MSDMAESFYYAWLVEMKRLRQHFIHDLCTCLLIEPGGKIDVKFNPKQNS